jgi:hypothetical protein
MGSLEPLTKSTVFPSKPNEFTLSLRDQVEKVSEATKDAGLIRFNLRGGATQRAPNPLNPAMNRRLSDAEVPGSV